jgi:hypothetical protein
LFLTFPTISPRNQDDDLIHSLCESWYKLLFCIIGCFFWTIFNGGLCSFKTVGFSFF